LFDWRSRGTPVTAHFGFGSPRRAASTLPALPWAAGGVRSDNRDRPSRSLNRRHRDNKSISVSLEFFAIVRFSPGRTKSMQPWSNA
jgi:hypothetical protein